MNDPKPIEDKPPSLPVEPAPKPAEEPFQLAPIEEPKNPLPPEPWHPPRFESRKTQTHVASHEMHGCFKAVFYLFAAVGMLIAAGLIYLMIVCS